MSSAYLKSCEICEKTKKTKIALVTKIFESRMTRIGISGNLVPIDTWVTMVSEYLPEKNFDTNENQVPARKKLWVPIYTGQKKNFVQMRTE